MNRFILFLLLWSFLISPSFAPILSAPSTEKLVPVQETVYVTKTGKKYHRSDCQHLRQSKIKTNKREAVKKGYTACKHCKP